MKNGAIWKVITAIIIPVLFFIGQNLIASDKESRTRDKTIEDCLGMTIKEQTLVNQAILIQLAKIDGRFETMQLDLSYIKKNVK